MRNLLVWGMAVWGSVLLALAARAAPEQSGAPRLRVLLITGGHGFEQAPFFKMFDERKDLTCRKAAYPQAAALLKPGLEKDCDVIVMYDMVKALTPEQQQALVALLNQGIGLVLLHHNLGAHDDWPEFTQIRGGKYFLKAGTVDGQAYPASTYAHDEEVKVAVADPEHFITKGIPNYVIHDEVYAGCYVAPSVHVLLKTDHPKSCRDLAWVHHYGKSRVFYLMSGHDAKAWANPNFTEILFRGIRWAAGRE
ncbi:MAG: ThuA domain-containing protein [Kiritimatiellaeota bacterium]|nr:ThuA domain-containing protein [Kiritimatiellota bacterium]